jgi:hypothetical protein
MDFFQLVLCGFIVFGVLSAIVGLVGLSRAVESMGNWSSPRPVVSDDDLRPHPRFRRPRR